MVGKELFWCFKVTQEESRFHVFMCYCFESSARLCIIGHKFASFTDTKISSISTFSSICEKLTRSTCLKIHIFGICMMHWINLICVLWAGNVYNRKQSPPKSRCLFSMLLGEVNTCVRPHRTLTFQGNSSFLQDLKDQIQISFFLFVKNAPKQFNKRQNWSNQSIESDFTCVFMHIDQFLKCALKSVFLRFLRIFVKIA